MGAPTLTEQRLNIVNQYMSSDEPWPATARQIAAWAIRQKLWAPQRASLISRCAEELARAMREEYYTDPQGREVRTKHAARILERGTQLTLWADIRTAERSHLEIAFKQRRQQIVGDCRQLKTDVDSCNENRDLESPIQLVLDFTDDVAELEALATLDVRPTEDANEPGLRAWRYRSAAPVLTSQPWTSRPSSSQAAPGQRR